jgi:uncharacterized protein YndB with AHSA1/START domain
VRSNRASVRRQLRIGRPAGEVWDLVGDPARLAEWFPGIVACDVDGTTRTITTGSGVPMPEQLLTIDPLQRRFQYRITAPLFTEHLGTIDVIDLDDGTSLVVYGTDADPATLALVIGGATGQALERLRTLLEGDQIATGPAPGPAAGRR